ncbi:MAG: hypothetical protein RLZZ142_267, partial [Verrucomicrobiota bacterium]
MCGQIGVAGFREGGGEGEEFLEREGMLLDALLGEKKGFGGHTEGGLKQGGGGLRMEGAKAMQKLG